MFLNRKRIVHLHFSGQIIRTMADHFFYIEGKGWGNAGNMPDAKTDGE